MYMERTVMMMNCPHLKALDAVTRWLAQFNRYYFETSFCVKSKGKLSSLELQN